jgi:hypothetical protein
MLKRRARLLVVADAADDRLQRVRYWAEHPEWVQWLEIRTSASPATLATGNVSWADLLVLLVDAQAMVTVSPPMPAGMPAGRPWRLWPLPPAESRGATDIFPQSALDTAICLALRQTVGGLRLLARMDDTPCKVPPF